MIIRSLILTIITAFSINTLANDPDTLVFSFQKQKNPEELKTATESVAQYLSQKLGKKIEVLVPTSYGASVQGLIAGKVHIAYMDSLPYILANAEKKIEIIAVENRQGKTNYDSLFIVGKNSNIQSIKDLKGKRIAFSSQTSTSGYLFPFYRLTVEKLVQNQQELDQYFSKIIYAGGYDKALLAVSQGQADIAALSDYAFLGPKADLYGTTETRSQLRILDRTSGVPTHLIAASGDLSKELINKIQKALLDLANEKPELLASVYGAAKLVKPTKNHVEKTQQALQATGLEVKSFVK